MVQSKTLLLIDGHALAFREYYALERTGMRTSDGIPTWAVFGFFKAIFDLLKKDELKIDAIVVTFDVSHQTFRTEAYEEYKANREKMPDDMSSQMELIYEGLEAFDIPIYMKEGFEADDVIGTISKKATEFGHRTLILTGDQDSFQLIDKEGFVKVIIPSKGDLVMYDWDKVYEKLGVYPNQVIDYKALRGDTSDNIPGVKGIGEKTAQNLLKDFDNLDNLYENTDRITPPGVQEKIINGKEIAYQSRFLATIIRDVDIDFNFDDACLKLPDMSKVKTFFTKYQMLSFLKNIQSLLNIFNRVNTSCESSQVTETSQLGLFGVSDENKVFPWKNDKIEINILDNEGKINDFCNLVTLDTGLFISSVQSGNDIMSRVVDYLVFGIKKIIRKGVRVQFPEDNEQYAKIFILPVNKSEIPANIKNVLGNEEIAKFTFDLKNEYNLLTINNCNLKNVVFDAVLASYVENSAIKHELETQALQYLKISPIDNPQYTGSELIDEWKQNVRDIWLTMCLAGYYYENLSDTNLKLLTEMELPLAKVLSAMELNGVAVNTQYLLEMRASLNEKISGLEKKIFMLTDEEFNINSPAQLGHVLFEKMNLPFKKRKKGTGNYSTDANILEELAKDYEVARDILEYRKYSKLCSTYTTGLIKLVSSVDNKIHTTYNQTVAVTGRLSSSNPNLQNIPARTDEGEKIRAAFVPESPDNKILSADYSQIELRILAHITQDKNLMEAFNNDIDVHTLTAAKVYEVPVEDVTKRMRTHAKAVNFGIVYGQTSYGLAQNLGITNSEAAAFIDKYFATYPNVRTYMNDIAQKVVQNGYTETIWGRRRYLNDEINSSNAMVREFAKRAAINFPMQGSAADLMKLAMINFYDELKRNNLKSKLIIQVHDEMVIDAVNEEIPLLKELLQKTMEFKDVLSVPLKIDIGVGDTWKAV